MKKTFLVLAISAMLVAAGCTPQDNQSTQTNTSTPQTTSSMTEQANSQDSTQQTQASQGTGTISVGTPDENDYPQLAKPKKGDTIAIMETDFGTIKFKLFTKDVPELTKNFIELSKANKYNGSPFHRVVQDFMIQGGDFTKKDGTGGYSYKGPGTELPNEIVPSIHHLYGTVSMAKTSAPVSIGSQFFIVTNHAGADFLDGQYSPIGQVYEGMDVAEKIQNLQMPGTESPSQVVNIKKVTITTFKG